jgi:hypothetical protein
VLDSLVSPRSFCPSGPLPVDFPVLDCNDIVPVYHENSSQIMMHSSDANADRMTDRTKRAASSSSQIMNAERAPSSVKIEYSSAQHSFCTRM